jgi:hypothetical protein
LLAKIRLINQKRKLSRQTPQLYLFEDIHLGYIQIPKVASRAIRNALTQFLLIREGKNPDEADERSVVQQYEAVYAKHLPNQKIADIANNNFLFAFVRNPFDRIYSCYKNKTLIEDGKKNIFEKNDIPSGISFDEFVQRVADIPDTIADRHFKAQSWFLTYQDKVIPQYVGKLETFSEDWEYLHQRFGITLPKQLNSSAHKNSTLTMCDKTKQLIIDRYKDDFRLFGYAQD